MARRKLAKRKRLDFLDDEASDDARSGGSENDHRLSSNSEEDDDSDDESGDDEDDGELTAGLHAAAAHNGDLAIPREDHMFARLHSASAAAAGAAARSGGTRIASSLSLRRQGARRGADLEGAAAFDAAFGGASTRAAFGAADDENNGAEARPPGTAEGPAVATKRGRGRPRGSGRGISRGRGRRSLASVMRTSDNDREDEAAVEAAAVAMAWQLDNGQLNPPPFSAEEPVPAGQAVPPTTAMLNAPTVQQRPGARTVGRNCGNCGTPGHNRRSCPHPERQGGNRRKSRGKGAKPQPMPALSLAECQELYQEGDAARAAALIAQDRRTEAEAAAAAGGSAAPAAAIDAAVPRSFYKSVTIIMAGGDVNPDHLDELADVLQEIAGPHALWMATLERGAKAGHLHFQCMAGTLTASATAMTNRLKCWAEPLGYTVSVRRTRTTGRRPPGATHDTATPHPIH